MIINHLCLWYSDTLDEEYAVNILAAFNVDPHASTRSVSRQTDRSAFIVVLYLKSGNIFNWKKFLVTINWCYFPIYHAFYKKVFTTQKQCDIDPDLGEFNFETNW